MSKDNGGPAFPVEAYDADEGMDVVQPGMSLRDYFAAQALAGIASMSGDGFSLSPEDEAAWAYQRADAMLAERNKDA